MGIGTVLSQTDENGHEHSIAFASCKLKPQEQKYAVIEKECLAVIWRFYPYLYEQHFIIETDHKPLKWLHQVNKNQRLTHWALSLQPFKYDVRHRAGTEHRNANGLSRGPPDTTMAIQSGEECDEVDKNQRLTHWALSLQPFKYDVRHRAGTEHRNANGLSRGPPDTTMAIQSGEECDEVEPQG